MPTVFNSFFRYGRNPSWHVHERRLPVPAAAALHSACHAHRLLPLPAHAAQEVIKCQDTLERLSHLSWEAGEGDWEGIIAVFSSGIKQGWWLRLGVSKPFCACTCVFAFWDVELSSCPFSFSPPPISVRLYFGTPRNQYDLLPRGAQDPQKGMMRADLDL